MGLRRRKRQFSRDLRRLLNFLGEGIWTEDVRRTGGMRGFFYQQLRVLVVVGRSLPRGQIPLRAAAMTLATLLALVPGILLAFTLLGAFGGFEQLREALQRFILENIVTTAQEQVSSFLERYFQGARAFQGISVIFLLGGVFGLLATIEDAFNQIWGIKRGRALSHRLTTYTTIAVLGPFLVALSLTMTASLQNAAALEGIASWAPVSTMLGFLFGLLPPLVTIFGLTLLYWIMPNAKVGLVSAFSGAFVAGVIWEISKWGFGFYLSSATMYQTLYGPLVAIPLLFLWIQLSWVIVLFGALLTFARETAGDFQLEEGAITAGYRDRLKAAIRCLVQICVAHQRGEAAPHVGVLAHRLQLPVRLARAVVGDLLSGRLLHEVMDDRVKGEGGLVPAKDLQNLTVYDVAACMLAAGSSSPPETMRTAEEREAERIVRQIDTSLENLGGPITFARIVATLDRRESELPDTGPVGLLGRAGGARGEEVEP